MPYRRLRRIEPWALEAALTFLSCWVALVLILPPSNFSSIPDLEPFEILLGLVACAAGCLQAGGLILAIYEWRPLCSLRIRMLGSGLAAFMWLLMGIPVLILKWQTIVGMTSIMFGLLCVWIVFRLPVLKQQSW